MKNLIKLVIYGLLLLPLLVAAAARDVQIQSVNFDTQVVQVTNLGTSTESLTGYRFCTHNTAVVRRYSTAISGRSLVPGESLYIHYLNDATQPDEINIATIGGNFAPMERGAYGMNLYFPPVNFGNGNTIADHLQWSIDGVDNLSADERSDEAVLGGVWVDEEEWIAVTDKSEHLDLTDLSGGVLHSPVNYSVAEPEPPAANENVPMMSLPFLAALLAIVGVIAGAGVRKYKA